MSNNAHLDYERRMADHMEQLRNFRLIDDDFMSKVFENAACAEVLLRIILDREDLIVQDVVSQCEIKNLRGRSIRLDIRAVDSNGDIYNVEIQRDDRGAHARRARYHSSLMDADITIPGERFQDLPESYVIFITENDVLGRELPIYHINRTIDETGERFYDGTHIIYVNSRIQDPNTRLGILMHDFWCTDHRDMSNPILANEVRYYKEDKEGIRNMSKIMEDLIMECVEEDRQETKEGFVRSLLAEGERDYDKIARCAGLPVDTVRTLAASAQ